MVYIDHRLFDCTFHPIDGESAPGQTDYPILDTIFYSNKPRNSVGQHKPRRTPTRVSAREPRASAEELPANAEELPANPKELPANAKELPANAEELPASAGELSANAGELPANAGEPRVKTRIDRIYHWPRAACGGRPGYING